MNRDGFSRVLILDTNVLLEILSIHDLLEAAKVSGFDPEAPEVVLRRTRARESLLFAIFLHHHGIATRSLHHEALRIFGRYVPATDPKAVPTTLFRYFVVPHVLPGWELRVVRDTDVDLHGNAADDLLLNWASELGIPLITREGYKKGSLRRKAEDAGAKVFNPGEYTRGKLDEVAAITSFFSAFDAHKLTYVIDDAGERSKASPWTFRSLAEGLAHAVQDLRAMLWWILRGSSCPQAGQPVQERRAIAAVSDGDAGHPQSYVEGDPETAQPAAAGPAEETDPFPSPRLVGVMPGALMYRVNPTHTFVQQQTDHVRQVRCLLEASAFSSVAEPEREALVLSLVGTLGRADYHYQRFQNQKQALDEIRAWAPGEVFWDGAVAPLHYELQAMAGAARVALDELLFLIAKRHHPTLSRRKAGEWEASTVLRKTSITAGSATDVSEVHRLRQHREWFDLLNAYRNTFFHRGWIHGSGHYDDDGRQAAYIPRMNALLVPDQGSLTGRSRPYDWTWDDRTRVENVASGVHSGLVEAICDVCTHEWNTATPPPGSLPDNERPNLFVALPIPIMLSIADDVIVPIYTSREKAVGMARSVLRAEPDPARHELIEIQSCPDVLSGEEAITVSFAGFEPEFRTGILHVCLDPEPRDTDWRDINAIASASTPLADLADDDIKTVAVPVTSPTTGYLWRTPFLVE